MSLRHAPWNRDFLDEVTLVPFGKYDDQVDAAAGAFAELALQPANTVTRRRITGF